jgi:dihydroorotate dehydrogenase (NAD+) catalytic subunit
LINTFRGMAVDWRRRRPVLGAGMGGVSGPAIKPMALAMASNVHRSVRVPVIGVGGIASIDDVMEFLVAGATAVQIGTANFYNPTLAGALVDQLEEVVEQANCRQVTDFVGTLRFDQT